MYTSCRTDRADGWGGVIIITKKNLTVEMKIPKECEMVAITVETNQKPVIFASCYRPPKNTKNEPLFGEIKQLTSIQRKDPIWIAGDLDLPDMD